MNEVTPAVEGYTSKYFLFIGILFVAVLLISNTVASKIVNLWGIFVPGAIVIFPISYIFGDILTEVYGYKASRRIIWSGFAAQLLMVFFYWLVQILPSAPFWQHQVAYEAILGAVPRIVLGSIVAYLAGEFTNSYVLSRMKIKSRGQNLWKRTIGSTLAGEAVDTIIFAVVAFGGILPSSALVGIALSGYCLKVAYEIIATPITYRVVRKLKELEGVDMYDEGISYNPFTLK